MEDFKEVNSLENSPKGPLPTGNNKNWITYGAMMLAITVVMVLAAIYVPIISMIIPFVWYIPIAYITYQFGFNKGLWVAVASLFLVSLFLGPADSLMLFLQYGALGLILGYGIRKMLSPWSIILPGTLFSLAALIISIIAAAVLSGAPVDNMLEIFNQYVTESVEGALQMAEESYGSTLSALEMESIRSTIMLMMPVMLVFLQMCVVMANYWITFLVFSRLKVIRVPRIPLYEWRLPLYTVWGLMIALVCIILGVYGEMPDLKQVGLYVASFFFPFFVVHGFAVYYAVFCRGRMATLMKIMLAAYILFLSVAAFLFLAVYGALDPLVDFRRLYGNKNKPGNNQDPDKNQDDRRLS